jgi:hypothetical protein
VMVCNSDYRENGWQRIMRVLHSGIKLQLLAFTNMGHRKREAHDLSH